MIWVTSDESHVILYYCGRFFQTKHERAACVCQSVKIQESQYCIKANVLATFHNNFEKWSRIAGFFLRISLWVWLSLFCKLKWTYNLKVWVGLTKASGCTGVWGYLSIAPKRKKEALLPEKPEQSNALNTCLSNCNESYDHLIVIQLEISRKLSRLV